MQNGVEDLHPRSREGPLPHGSKTDVHQQEKQQQQQQHQHKQPQPEQQINQHAQQQPNADLLQLSKPPYILSAEEVANELGADPDQGLSEEEAQSRLTRVGLNELTGGGGVSAGRILAKQIFNAMVLVCSHTSLPHAPMLII